MSELSNEEQERLENWKSLQLALGLSPDEAPPPGPKAESVKAPEPTVQPAMKYEKKAAAAEENDEIHLFGEGIIPAEPIVESAAEVEEGQEVEVGEAPEEIPDEPSPPEEKKRRRRRRRRGRRGGEAGGEAQDEAAEQGEAGPLFDTGAEPPAAAEADELEEDEEGSDEDEDEVEVEPISFVDWTVPTWNELIGSLYRPER